MRHRIAVVLLSCAIGVCGCSTLGEAEVRVDTGNQPSGYLSRPLQVTISSDESVQAVAQRICDNVKPGSYAEISFVGKEPGPDPFDIGDWGRYRYDCGAAAAAKPAPPPVATIPAAPDPAAAPVEGAAKDDQHGRDCQRQQGTYQICLGGCMLNSTSAPATVAAECQQRCAPKQPVGCN